MDKHKSCATACNAPDWYKPHGPCAEGYCCRQEEIINAGAEAGIRAHQERVHGNVGSCSEDHMSIGNTHYTRSTGGYFVYSCGDEPKGLK